MGIVLSQSYYPGNANSEEDIKATERAWAFRVSRLIFLENIRRFLVVSGRLHE